MDVLVYSAPWCIWCHKTKEFLKTHKIKFKEIDVDEDKEAVQEMFRKSGQLGIPVTDVDGKIIIGYDVPALKKALKIKD